MFRYSFTSGVGRCRWGRSVARSSLLLFQLSKTKDYNAKSVKHEPLCRLHHATRPCHPTTKAKDERYGVKSRRNCQ